MPLKIYFDKLLFVFVTINRQQENCLGNDTFYAPFEDGGHIALHLSVGRFVGQSLCWLPTRYHKTYAT